MEHDGDIEGTAASIQYRVETFALQAASELIRCRRYEPNDRSSILAVKPIVGYNWAHAAQISQGK